MEFKVTGKIVKILDKQSGTSKKGVDWVKQSFVIDNNEKYNNIYCFDLFGEEKVENLNKYNKVGDTVEVSFNIRTNEYEGKYYMSLDAWKVFKADSIDKQPAPAPPFETVDELNEPSDDLPF